MKNISSLFYFQKNRPIFEKTSTFKTSLKKNTLKLTKLYLVPHLSNFFGFQIRKSLFTKKQKNRFSSLDSLSIDQKEQEKRILPFQKILKTKEFCIFLVLEFFRLCETYFERFQFFCEQFLFNFFQYSFSPNFLKTKKNIFLPQLEFFNLFSLNKKKQNSVHIFTFLFSLLAFFFFFLFKKTKEMEKQKKFFSRNERGIFVKNSSFISKRFFFQKICFLFQRFFHYVQDFFSNIYFFSKKKVFQNHFNFFPYFQCFDQIFHFLYKGLICSSQRNFQFFSPFSLFEQNQKKLKICQYKYRIHPFMKKLFEHSQSFFPFFKKGQLDCEHLFSQCQRLPFLFFEKKLRKKKDLLLKFDFDSCSTLNFLTFTQIKQKHIFSFFSDKNVFSSFHLSFSLFPSTGFCASFKKSLFCFLQNLQKTSNSFLKQTKDFGKSFLQKIQIIQGMSNEFFISRNFQKSFFHVFHCSENQLFEKIQLLFYGNYFKKVCFSIFCIFFKNFHIVHFFSKKSFFGSFQQKWKFQIQKIVFAFQVLQEKHFFVFAKNKNFLSSFCSRFFESCHFLKSQLFGFSNVQNFFNMFENFVHVFSKIQGFFDKKSSFHFFEKKKIQSFFSLFFFRNSFFSFFNLFFQENFLFQKHSLFFPKKNFLKIRKIDNQFEHVFSLKTTLFMILHSFDHKFVHKNLKTFVFFPLQKTLFPFLFKKSLVFVFFEFQPSFQKLFVYGKIPSRDAVQKHLEECQNLISRSRAKIQVVWMTKLQTKIAAWSKQQKNSFSKEIFEYCDFVLQKILWNWARKMHPNKSKMWLQKKYFYCVEFQSKKKWFFGKKIQNFFLCLPLHEFRKF